MISCETQGAVRVLAPSAPLTEDLAGELLSSVQKPGEIGLPQVVVDLAATPLVDSAGLDALLDARDSIRGRGGIMKLAAANPLVGDALEATGVGDHFELFETCKAAVRSFAR